MACEMDGSFDEPFADDSTTSRRNATFVVKSSDIVGIRPAIGDRIVTDDGRRFSVSRVQPFGMIEFILEARQV